MINMIVGVLIWAVMLPQKTVVFNLVRPLFYMIGLLTYDIQK